ncbi:MAG: hypothetical protein E7509_07220 [Ruminococcus sp.]|nr:hypothetical protein [Ruminococcus sp.]
MRVSKNNLGNLKFEIICLCIVLVGVAVGTLCFLTDVDLSFLSDIFYKNHESNGLLSGEVFLKYFLFGSFVLLVIFLCGFSAVYQPLIFLSSLFVGICYGFPIAEIYSYEISGGLLFAVLTVVIPCLITVFALMIACREAFYLSVSIAGAIFSEKNFIGFKEAVRMYVVKFLVLEAIIAVGAFVRCLLFSFF